MKFRKKAVRRMSFLLCFCLIAVAIPIYIYNDKGNLDDVALPDGFVEDLRSDSFDNKADVRVMSSNLLAHYTSWGGVPGEPRAKMFIEVLKEYSPDVVGLQELCDSWYCLLGKNMPDNYKMLFPISTGVFVNMTAMIYNADTLRLVECDKFAYEQGDNIRLRRVVWGVFEVIATGEKFAVANTHFDLLREGYAEEQSEVVRSQAKELIACVDDIGDTFECPVFILGDFNAMEDREYTNPINNPEAYNMLAYEYEDIKYKSKYAVSGSEQDWNSISFDHIFMKGCARTHTFAVLSYKYLTDMSDHYPIFADINLK